LGFTVVEELSTADVHQLSAGVAEAGEIVYQGQVRDISTAIAPRWYSDAERRSGGELSGDIAQKFADDMVAIASDLCKLRLRRRCTKWLAEICFADDSVYFASLFPDEFIFLSSEILPYLKDPE
jgi:hypothetical protein